MGLAGGQWCARRKYWCETPTLQLPWSSQHVPPECTHCASPWRLSVITSLACYQVLPSTAGLPRLVNIFSTYRRPVQDKTKASTSICFSQVSHTSLQSSQSSVHEALTNYLIVLTLRHSIIFAAALVACDISCHHRPSIFLRVENIFLSFSLSPLLKPVFHSSFYLRTAQVLSSPLSPILLYFLSWQLSLVLWPTSLQFSHEAMPIVLVVSIGK